MNFANVKSITIPEGKVTKITSGGVVIWKLVTPSGPAFTNQVPLSTEADGKTIYNGGLGYKNGYRIRSGGAEGELAASAHTGFIPVKAGDVIRIGGLYFGSTYSHGSAMNVANSSFTNIGQFSMQSGDYGIFIQDPYKAYSRASVVQEKADVWKWVVPPASSGVAYIRVSCNTYPIGASKTYPPADGSKLIVTINEEINLYKNWVEYAIDTDGSFFNGIGYRLDTRLNSSAAEVAIADYGVSGYIPVKAGDVVRVRGAMFNTSYATGGYFWTFDENFTKLKSERPADNSTEDISVVQEENGVTAFHLVSYNTDVRYIRLSAYGLGPNTLITVNEEIK